MQTCREIVLFKQFLNHFFIEKQTNCLSRDIEIGDTCAFRILPNGEMHYVFKFEIPIAYTRSHRWDFIIYIYIFFFLFFFNVSP